MPAFWHPYGLGPADDELKERQKNEQVKPRKSESDYGIPYQTPTKATPCVVARRDGTWQAIAISALRSTDEVDEETAASLPSTMSVTVLSKAPPRKTAA